jgi:hypothetical protein
MPEEKASQKPALKSVDSNGDLLVYENLERNPPAKRDSLLAEFAKASKNGDRPGNPEHDK